MTPVASTRVVSYSESMIFIRKAKGIKRLDQKSIEVGGYGGAGCCHMISKPAGLPGGHQLLRHSNINNLGFVLSHPRYFCIIHLVLSCERGRSNLVLRPWSPPSSPHNPSDFAPPADLLAWYPEICTVRFTFGLLSAFDQSLCSCSKVMSVFHLKDLHYANRSLPRYFVETADYSFAQLIWYSWWWNHWYIMMFFSLILTAAVMMITAASPHSIELTHIHLAPYLYVVSLFITISRS